MEQKQTKSLNGFTECLLVLGIIGCIASVVLSAIAITEDTVTVSAGIYTIIASIIQAFFIVKIMGLHKLGVYGYFTLVVVDIIAAFIFADGEYSVAFGVAGRDAFKAAIFLACLFFLKKNGVCGWDVIMK